MSGQKFKGAAPFIAVEACTPGDRWFDGMMKGKGKVEEPCSGWDIVKDE
jgi:hypothetical protein